VNRKRASCILGLVALAGAACSGGQSGASGASERMTVLAAASLTEAFTELGQTFEAGHPGLEVAFSFGASSTLAQQAVEGAPADVLATADEASMQKAVDDGAASGPRVFARNRLAILVGQGNPKAIAGLADLAQPGVVLVMCAPQVPCGRFGAQALVKAGVRAEPKSLEENVKGVVAKVTLGEADAGIVYASDARSAAARSDAVDIPDDHNVVASYPIARLQQATNTDAARAFVELVVSREGQATLARYGFRPA
jgi:molybdate transport system substrate-binding protein